MQFVHRCISVGSSGVFWGGAGADTFNFTSGITNSAGTAYFWNADAGTDSINLANVGVSSGFGFGVTATGGLVVNFGTVSDGFGTAAATTNVFKIADSTNVATIAYSGTTGVFLTFAGGADITFLGAAGLAGEISTTFSDTTGTIAFGAAVGTFPTFS